MEIDFEKAYNEALERAKRLRDSKYQTMNAKRVVEEIFPELRESEDEEIRKLLVWQVYRNIEDETNDLAQSVYDGIKGHDPDLEESIEDWKKCLAYLEKLKDASKAIEAVERIDKYIDRYLANAHDMDDSNPYKKYYRGWDDALGKMAGILQDVYSEAEQKEQTSDIILKAFENSKTDYSLEEREEASDYSEKVLPTSIACGESEEEYLLHKVIEAAYIAGQKEQKPTIAGNDFGWIDELKHDLEHQEELDQKVQEVLKKRQKPVERSLEDDHIIGFVYDLLNEIEWKDNWAMSKKECLERLKSLRPQSKDETYKEKDEAFKLGKHQLAVTFMKYLDDNRPDGKMGLSNGECEDIDKAFKENDWAKIMRYIEKYRPHWKPSEEQMDALADTLEDMPEHYKPKCTLETLERDLRKLM